MARPVRCTACGHPGSGAFCPQCGRPSADRARERRAWLVGWTLVGVAVVVVVAGLARAPAARSAAPAGGIPDLAGLASLPAPERFAEVFDRMMRAGSEGDSMAVAHLSPVAAEAYADLDSLDADTRFHAGLIAIQTGDFAGARALADSIEAHDPGHLFGPILDGALARLEGDTAGFNAAVRLFRGRADGELARSDRPEYAEHAQLLTEVRQAAEIK